MGGVRGGGGLVGSKFTFFTFIVRSFMSELNFSLSAHVSAKKNIQNTHNFHKIATFVREVNMCQLAPHRGRLAHMTG